MYLLLLFAFNRYVFLFVSHSQESAQYLIILQLPCTHKPLHVRNEGCRQIEELNLVFDS